MNYIQGGVSIDERGSIRYVNNFDMTQVKRFYIIKNCDTEMIRGWRAHRLEQRWFYVLSGSFAMDTVKIDNWESPSQSLPVEKKTIKAADGQVIHIPRGFGTLFQALEPHSELLVFADYGIEHASLDDYTYPNDYFENREPSTSF